MSIVEQIIAELAGKIFEGLTTLDGKEGKTDLNVVFLEKALKLEEKITRISGALSMSMLRVK